MIEKHPQSILMKVNAWFVVIAWAAFLSVAVFFILGISGINIEGNTIVNIFMVFVVFALGHLILGLCLICPICGKRSIVQGMSGIHRSSNQIGKLDGWAVVVINIITKGRFRCIHCGSEFYI